MISSDGPVPGVPIHHIPASTQTYLSSPSITVLSGGVYVVSLARLGRGAATHDTFVFRSEDAGITWSPEARIKNQVWSTLFAHNDCLYLLGTDHADRYHGRLNGRIVIRRSHNKGRDWTEPQSAETGLLTDLEGYHTAPTPVIIKGDRVWKAYEYAPEPNRGTWQALVVSAQSDADLLKRGSWTFSARFAHTWSKSQWIEGNMVAAPDGHLVNLLRTNYQGDDPARAQNYVDRAALVHVSGDGLELTHNRDTDRLYFPGGGSKFTVRHDRRSGLYWSLVNKQTEPQSLRNALYLSCSSNLRDWRIACRVLYHPDPGFHAFQYVDWVFEGDDIVLVSRTAWDDHVGGPRNYHDANYITFHRIAAFRTFSA